MNMQKMLLHGPYLEDFSTLFQMNRLFLDILAMWDEVEYVFRGVAVCLCVLFVFRLVSLHMESRARKPFRFCQPSGGSSLRVYAQLTRLYSVLRIYDVAIQCNTPMMSKHMNSGHMSRCSHGRTHQVPCAVQTKSGSRHARTRQTPRVPTAKLR